MGCPLCFMAICTGSMARAHNGSDCLTNWNQNSHQRVRFATLTMRITPQPLFRRSYGRHNKRTWRANFALCLKAIPPHRGGYLMHWQLGASQLFLAALTRYLGACRFLPLSIGHQLCCLQATSSVLVRNMAELPLGCMA